jgi:hypothetical protein
LPRPLSPRRQPRDSGTGNNDGSNSASERERTVHAEIDAYRERGENKHADRKLGAAVA